jgi:hypothetical protein
MNKLIVVGAIALSMSLALTVKADTVNQSQSNGKYFVQLGGDAHGTASEVFELMGQAKLPIHSGIAGYSYNEQDISAMKFIAPHYYLTATFSSGSPFKIVQQGPVTKIYLAGQLAAQLTDIMIKAGTEVGGPVHAQGLHQYSNGKSIRCAQGATVFGGVSCAILVKNLVD